MKSLYKLSVAMIVLAAIIFGSGCADNTPAPVPVPTPEPIVTPEPVITPEPTPIETPAETPAHVVSNNDNVTSENTNNNNATPIHISSTQRNLQIIRARQNVTGSTINSTVTTVKPTTSYSSTNSFSTSNTTKDNHDPFSRVNNTQAVSQNTGEIKIIPASTNTSTSGVVHLSSAQRNLQIIKARTAATPAVTPAVNTTATVEAAPMMPANDTTEDNTTV